jgi:hypothetical protein
VRLGLGISRPIRGWEPRLLSGCKLWLRADRGITLASTKVSAWTDQSGNGVTVSQGTDANRPTFTSADPSVTGTSATTKLAVSGMSAPTAVTYVVVLKRGTNANSYMLAGTNDNMGFIENFTANTIEWFNGGGTDRLTFAGTRTAGFHICTLTQTNGAGIVLYYDGVQAATKGTAAANLLAIGALLNSVSGSNGNNGSIAELIAYDRVLPAAERTRLHDNLKAHWAIV